MFSLKFLTVHGGKHVSLILMLFWFGDYLAELEAHIRHHVYGIDLKAVWRYVMRYVILTFWLVVLQSSYMNNLGRIASLSINFGLEYSGRLIGEVGGVEHHNLGNPDSEKVAGEQKK